MTVRRGVLLETAKSTQKVHQQRTVPANFGLLPNGVLCLRDGPGRCDRDQAFVRKAPDSAAPPSQGRCLVIDGKLHPRFLKDGTSRYNS